MPVYLHRSSGFSLPLVTIHPASVVLYCQCSSRYEESKSPFKQYLSYSHLSEEFLFL